jgi:O-antigen/teichoic acid export membrane protein
MNVAIDIVFIPRIGIVAAAIGTDVAYTFYVLGHFWICKTTMGLSLRPIAIVLLRTTVAVAAMAGVLLAIGTPNSVAEWALGVVGGSLAFAAALIATREVSGAELRLAWNFAGRQLPRRAGA